MRSITVSLPDGDMLVLALDINIFELFQDQQIDGFTNSYQDEAGAYYLQVFVNGLSDGDFAALAWGIAEYCRRQFGGVRLRIA